MTILGRASLRTGRQLGWIVAVMLVAALGLLLPLHRLFGWGQKGHEIVALIAEHCMSPAALERAQAILGGAALETWRAGPMITAGTTPKRDLWHYIDIPLVDSRIDLRREWPNGNCVTGKTEQLLAVLRDSNTDETAKAQALRFVIHFAGDMHQPLHDEDDADKGGNAARSSSKAVPTTCTGSGTPA